MGKVTPGYCVILCYYAIGVRERNPFASQMDDIIRWAKPIAVGNKESFKDVCRYSAVTFDDGFMGIIEVSLPELAERNIPAAIFVPTGNFGQHSKWVKDQNDPISKDVVMTVEQSQELQDNKLVSIGCHSVTHSDLLILSEEKVRSEIFESRRTLEQILDQDVNFLSFPHGAYTNDLVEWAFECRYKSAFSIDHRLAFTEPNEFITGRIKVSVTDCRLEFVLKLFGAYRWLPAFIKVKSKIADLTKIVTQQGYMYNI